MKLPQGPVTYDSHSLLINAERIWLASAESHYFRHTADTWEEVLWRIKRAGLNTVSTYVAWNRHEPVEGAFDFSGDLDLGRFLDLAEALGLYVFARPGPYICSEWTGGGFPGWLQAKEGIYLREENGPYLDAVKAYWDRLIPILVERQVDKGGAVILVQSENEYRHLYCPERRNYQQTLIRWLREYGISVPITGCNAHSHDGKTIVFFGDEDLERSAPIKDLVMTYNTGLDALPLEDLRVKQPEAPLFVTEQWCGGLMHWDAGANDWPQANKHNAGVTAMLGCGGMVNYYMFEGGTNFGHNGGQWFATGYGSAYPVGEGGALQEKYWALKPLNHLQECLPEWFASSKAVDNHGWQAPEGSLLRVRQSGGDALLFWSQPQKDAQHCRLSHPEEESLALSVVESPHAVLPLGFSVFEGHRVDRANVSLMWIEALSRTVFFYGAPGAKAAIHLDGEVLEGVVLHHEPVVLRSASGVQCVILDEFLAGRFWPLDDGSICLGAYYVKGDGSITRDRDYGLYQFSDGILKSVDANGRLRVEPKHTALPQWRNWSATESVPLAAWSGIDKPMTHEELGVYEGGLWYRASLEADAAGWQNLLVPAYGAGLVSVYQNGEYVGILGESRIRSLPNIMERPRDQWREQLSVYLQAGRNEFVFYSEDMGRPAGGTPAPRGLSGDVFVGPRPMDLQSLTDVADAPVSEAAFRYLRQLDFAEPVPSSAIDFSLTVQAGEEIYLSLPLPLLDLFADCFAVKSFAIEVDGKVLDPVGIPSCEMNAFQIPVAETGGTVAVRLIYQGSRQVLLSVLKAWACPLSAKLSDWSWVALEAPEFIPADADSMSIQSASESRLLFPVSLDDKVESKGCRPTWYATTFPDPGEGKHFLRIGKLQKGQIYLNGHHVGRYWQKKPAVQTEYYLPAVWMRSENRIMIFEETGVPPVNTALITKDSV
jgi:hypothetical protein